jgi:hypothetical protein
MKMNIITKGQEILNLKRRTDKYSEKSLDSVSTLNSLNNKNN